MFFEAESGKQRRGGFAIVCASALLSLAAGAGAQEVSAIDPVAGASRARYQHVLDEISLSGERRDRLLAEIQTIRKDRATISAALIQSAKTEKKLGQDIEDIAGRLDTLDVEREALKGSLAARRGVLAEVLGALQRMGLNPPPAVLVKPEDALSSVRSAILLGAVVPQLRGETEILLGDLRELSAIGASIEAERAKLSAAVNEQREEKARLGLLLDEQQALQGQTEAALDDERRKSEGLAAKANSLKELIASLEKLAEEKRLAAEAAAREEAARVARDERLAALPVPEANRLAATTPFSALFRRIGLPAAGRLIRRFGGFDDNGGVMQGDTLATQSGAIVTAPADGTILYAGPFRSYGQLLILNAGHGYHLVMAGIGKINATLGQTVLAGEPIGAMGEARIANAAATPDEMTGPELYIEFRKDGKPVDPAPWWADRLSGRTGNDS